MPLIPKFKTKFESVLKGMDTIIRCESVSLNGIRTKVNGKATSVLTIGIINGQNLSGDEDLLKSSGFNIAVYMKKALTDPSEYDKYNVEFVKEVNDGGATRKSWVRIAFDSKDIKIVD